MNVKLTSTVEPEFAYFEGVSAFRDGKFLISGNPYADMIKFVLDEDVSPEQQALIDAWDRGWIHEQQKAAETQDGANS